MDLFRIHAYEVTPQRLAETVTPPRGGAFTADASFKTALNDYLTKSKLQSQATVDLRRSRSSGINNTPSHDLRRHVLDYCYGATGSAKSAAVAMATRLGQSMDNRSLFTLLMLVAYKDGVRRRLIMWAFPKDEPFHFTANGDRAKIKILKDAFSRSSSFKKAALFEGINASGAFWSGNVIDKQAENGTGGAAEYWVDRFLDACPSLSGKAGTRLLAKCLKRTHDDLSDQADKDQISNAVIAIRASQRRQWSLRKFANEFLSGSAKQTFLQNSPAESSSATFTFSKQDFDQKINFRVFRLQDNVMVAAPFGSIGQSVTLVDGAQRRLKCEGIVVSEKMRSQHVG